MAASKAEGTGSEPRHTQSLQHACRSFAFPEPGLALPSSSSSVHPNLLLVENLERAEMHVGSSGSLPTGRVPNVPKQSRRGPDAEKVPLPSFVKEELHRKGRCEPCLYNSKPGGDVGTAKNAASVISARQNKYERGRAGNIIWRDFSEGKGSSKQKEQQEQDSLFLHFQSSQNKTYVAYAWDCLGIFAVVLFSTAA